MPDSIYQIITDTIIQKLRADAILRRTPWISFGSLRSLVPGKSRRGIAAIRSAMTVRSRPRWLAFKQAQKAASFILGKGAETHEAE